MKPSVSAPPIASPHGGGEPVALPPLDTEVAYVVVSFPFGAAFRYALFDWLTPCTVSIVLSFPLVFALAVLPWEMRYYGLWALPRVYFLFLAFVFVLAEPLVLLVRLCSSRLFLVRLSSHGISKFYPQREVHYPWRQLQWVIERGGDLWITNVVDGCFIPRDCFASPEDAAEFAALVRELKASKGASWQAQLNGRVFGMNPYNPTGELPTS